MENTQIMTLSTKEVINIFSLHTLAHCVINNRKLYW